VTLYRRGSAYVKDGDIYKIIQPMVKVNGEFRECPVVWAKINDVWTPVSTNDTASFAQDQIDWTSGHVAEFYDPPPPAGGSGGDWGGGGDGMGGDAGGGGGGGDGGDG
jgi:hypothetical protein